MKEKTKIFLTVIITYLACSLTAILFCWLLYGIHLYIFVPVLIAVLSVVALILARKCSKGVNIAYIATLFAAFTLFLIPHIIFDLYIGIKILKEISGILAMTFGLPSMMLAMGASEWQGIGGMFLFVVIAVIPVIPCLVSFIIEKTKQ